MKQKSAPILSQQLIEALRQRYEDREQSILFLNRRGFNTTMFCTECGEVEQCRDCSIAMTYHRTDHYLHCHLCGYRNLHPEFAGIVNRLKLAGVGTAPSGLRMWWNQ